MDNAIVFLVLLIIFPAAYADDHTVGDSRGWTIGVNYVAWASSQTFTTGDTLEFTFGPTHAVVEVTQVNYENCNAAIPIATNTSSPTTISLDKQGIRYFICPTPNHCAGGQKLVVNVTGGSPSSDDTPPPAGGSAPSTPSGTPGSPPSTTAPSPPSASATFDGRSGFTVGSLSLVLATVGLFG